MKKNLWGFFTLLCFSQTVFAATEYQENSILTPESSNNSQKQSAYVRFRTKNPNLIVFCQTANLPKAIRIVEEYPEILNHCVTMEIEKNYFKNDLIPTLIEIYPTTLKPEYKELIFYFFYKFPQRFFNKADYETIRSIIKSINNENNSQRQKKYRKRKSDCGDPLRITSKISSEDSNGNSNSINNEL